MATERTQPNPIEFELARIARLPLADLRVEWTKRWRRRPQTDSLPVLLHMFAWRLQAESQGGLSTEASKLLKARSAPRRVALPVGCRVTREYEGVLYSVDALDGGYLFRGRRYLSLSAIAREITGVRWNGPRFFGLRKTSVA